MAAPPPEDVTWVRVDATRALAVPRALPLEAQARLIERVTHALEALAQHGSTSAEESLAGFPLRLLEDLRAAGVPVVSSEALGARLAPPDA